MADEASFRRRNPDFNTKETLLSKRESQLNKREDVFGKKDSDSKAYDDLFNRIKENSENMEAGADNASGFRKRKNKKSTLRTRQAVSFRNSGIYDYPDADNATAQSDSKIYNNDKMLVRDIHASESYNTKNENVKMRSRDNNTEKNNRIRNVHERRIAGHVRNKTKKGAETIKNEINDSADINSTEYRGNTDYDVKDAERSFKGAVRTAGAVTAVVVKAFASALFSIIGWTGLAAVLAIGGTVMVVQNATYDFIVDEDKIFRENISQISSDFTNDISAYANENGCTRTVVTGGLADWKEVIAFWWTLRNNYGKNEQYNNLLSGDDCSDLKEIFYEFNEASYEIEETDDGKILKVTITNKTVDDMAKYWLFTSEQKLYLDDLIAADEIWDSVLGMNNLAMAAYSELGQTAEKYYNTLALHDGDEWSIAFVYYILKENGYVSDNYVRKTSSIEAFRQYCILYKWMTLTPSIGDIAFIKINGSDRVGIISNIDDDYIYIILGNYDRTGIVKEIYVSKSSGILTGAYAHISLPDVVSVINSNSFYTIGNGECLWPVPGKYYVTSPYGARWGTIHKGLDISCPIGTSVVAAKSGTVISSYRSSSAGEYIVIDHGDGMCTEYMHNSIRLVSSGDYVDAGQVIAYSGNTGQSTGPHCHFGVRINGERVDPAPYLGIPSQIGDVSEYVTGE